MNLRKLQVTVPWITAEGFDPAQFPIDGILKQALSPDREQYRSGLVMLESMYGHGRHEAGIFLLGLLVVGDGDWDKRIAIVEALRFFETKACADMLFGELSRTKCSNTTRAYLTTIVKTLAGMPSELVLEGFTSLANDKSFSPRMREKFKAVLHHDGLASGYCF